MGHVGEGGGGYNDVQEKIILRIKIEKKVKKKQIKLPHVNKRPQWRRQVFAWGHVRVGYNVVQAEKITIRTALHAMNLCLQNRFGESQQ